MNFGRTLVVSFHILPLFLWDQGCGGIRSKIKLSGKKIKRRSIRMKVDLYEVFLSYNIYFLLFYLMNILTPFFSRFVVYLPLGERI